MSRLSRWPRADHKRAAANARREPGVWQSVNTYRSHQTARGMAYMIRTGHPISGPKYGTPYLPAEAFETRLVPVDDGTALEVRFISTIRKDERQ
jgi:hypothetical protein